MNVYHHIDSFPGCPSAVVTTGTFDGVHKGHLQIIRKLRETAAACGGETVLLTFYPHPRMVLFPDQPLHLLNTQEERTALLAAAGIDHLIIHPFTREFSMLDSLTFIKEILVEKLGTKKLVIGYDHHFGRNREGSFAHLKEFGPVYGFEVEEIPELDVNNMQVSSTKIRRALETGAVAEAAVLLGYPYPLTGTVVKGQQLGRTLGFPTANLQVNDPNKLVPADGVYAVLVESGGKTYRGMLGIGKRPTIDGKHRTIETNILNFDKDIYGETITLHFIAYLRDDQKFENLEALTQQLFADRDAAHAALDTHETLRP